jgi:PKD repeat protein
MNKKLSIIIILGCLFVVANMGLAGIPSQFFERDGDNPIVTNFSLEKSESIIKNIDENEISEGTEDLNREKDVYEYKTDTYNSNAGGPYSADVNEIIEFDGSNSYFGFKDILTYEWDFGDGNIEYGKKTVHKFTDSGIYYATLTATDSKGVTYQDIAPVYINQEGNHLLPYGGCTYTANIDEEIIFDGSLSQSNDPDSKIEKWIWDFGDGTLKEGKIVSHSYSEKKVYLVTLEIEDEKGFRRLDVLHADIGVSYSSMEDFFISSNPKFKTSVDVLFNKIGSIILYPLLFVRIYTNYNGYEQSIPLSSGYLLPLSVDVNHDGDEDVVVNDINFFKPVISNSPFNDKPWFAFESTISDIQIISDDIKTEDNFTICLQFSVQILEDFLNIKEPVIRVGYISESGEEKPDDFSATHIFRPYLLNRIRSPNAQIEDVQQSIPVIKESQKFDTNHEISSIGSITTKKLNLVNKINSEIPQAKDLNKEPENHYIDQKEIINNDQEKLPENGLRVNSSNVDKFSLILSFSNVFSTTKTSLELTFESFTSTTLTHRRGETLSDLDFKGTDNSSITLSITKTNQQGSATLGVFIDPIQNCGFSVDVGKLANEARHITFNIENPPENLALFAERQDLRNESNSLYFYLKKLPNSIDFEWLPKFSNGYITLTKEFDDDELIVGICDDLKDPDTNIYVSNLPTETSVDWEISSETPRSMGFSSDTDGLTLNAEIKDLSQENQTIDFQATSNEDLDVKFLWSLLDGYFELQRSTKNIDFDFLMSQDNLELNVNGNYQGGPDDGFKLDFDGLKQGLVEFNSDKSLDLSISVENFEKETTLSTDLAFSTDGGVKLEWDEFIKLNFNGSASIALGNFLLNSPNGYVSAQEIGLEKDTIFGFEIIDDAELQISGSGDFSFAQFECEIGDWSNSISDMTIGGTYDIQLQPLDKYFEFDSTQSIYLTGFNINYDGLGEENDIIFEIDTLDIYSGGNSWFDFSSDTPKFNLDSEDYLHLIDFHLAVGTGSSSVIDFTLTNAYISKEGTIFGEWNSEYLYVDAAVDFDWDFEISTLNFGDWETYGDIEGSATIFAQWESGSGNISFDISDTGLSHDFEIIHDDLTLNLGTMDLEPGDITFEWQREDNPTNGYFNVLNNGITGDLSLCKITYDDSENPFIFELGTINLDSGDLLIEWSRQTDDKFIHIDNDLTIDMDLLKITWNEKSISLEDLILSPGEFNFNWNFVEKVVTINNGIGGLGPSLTYEDDDKKLSLSLLDLQDDYSKTMTAKWFEDSDDNVSGIYLDTDGVNLVDWIKFSYVKYDPSGNNGRQIAIGGLQADDFTIIKNEDNNVDISGRIYLANHITYSKLVDDEWKDLDIQWDIDLDGIGNIQFAADPAFNVGLELTSKFSGVDINTTFDLPNFLNISWDIDFDGDGYIGIDTDSEEVYELDFWFYKETVQYQPKWGIYLNCLGVIAEDYVISWDFTPPPGQWIMQESGYIEPGSINDMHLAWNGNWFDVMTAGTPI